jgi:hypothetical protein
MFPEVTAFFQKITGVFDSVSGFFNSEFWSLIAFTGAAVVIAVMVGYFFPVLRGLMGAMLVGIAGTWYGYTKGQDSKEREIAKLKTQLKTRQVTPQVKKQDWKW